MSAVTQRVALALCRFAAIGLPVHEQERYTEEWEADLAADPAHALAYATSMVLHSPAMWLTVTGVSSPDRPLLCKLSRHHYVTVHDNPENRRFTSHVCTRCGHIKDDWRGPSPVNDGYAWGSVPGTLH